jgi:hypothetical protein
VAVVALCLALAPAAGASAKAPCRVPSNGKLIAKSTFATIYSVTNKRAERFFRACLPRSRDRIPLESETHGRDTTQVRAIELAGRYVGWVFVRGDSHYSPTHVNAKVYDLRKRRLRAFGGGPERPVGDPAEVTDLALGLNGRLAFITREFRPEYPDAEHRPGEWRGVWALDASGSRVLEQGANSIDLTSLELSSFTATWTSAGEARSAQLY